MADGNGIPEQIGDTIRSSIAGQEPSAKNALSRAAINYLTPQQSQEKETGSPKSLKFSRFVSGLYHTLRKTSRALGAELEKSFPSAVFKTELVHLEDTFNLSQALLQTSGPFIEVAGPTDTEYRIGYHFIDTQYLSKKVHVSNIKNGCPIL